MPPLGKPSAISYSRSSARSDLKTFTFPLAPYNFRMRAICDESDMRNLLAIVQPCPYKAILQPTGNLCRWRANDAGRDMTFIKIKVFDTCAEIIGYAVLNACTGRPGAIGYGRTGAASRNCETRPQLAGGPARRPVNEVAIKSHTEAATQRCEPWHLTPAAGQYTCRQRLALRGGVVVGLNTPNNGPSLKVRTDLRTADEPRFVDRRTPPAAR